ncbi:Bud site selection protein bud4 [Parahypoxylon ruwenzoriense]
MASDEQPVTQPLRISKASTPSSSPTKSSIPRPLSEISATEQRRNSPSWVQPPKKMGLNTDSSPFQSSPLDGTTSPRLFWQNRNINNRAENDLYGGRTGSPSPNRRSSIERLQKASRVKNSTMFAREQKQEYDPTRIPALERPLAKVQGNAYIGSGFGSFRGAHGRSESQSSIPLFSSPRGGSRSTPAPAGPQTPSKEQSSPIKSSLSSTRQKNSQDSQAGDIFSDLSFQEHQLPSGKSLHRHAKSVTFDAAPPQVNEYEMATPDLSSVGTNSREGSFEDDEDEDDYLYDHYPGEDGEGQDDSFDATLEDTNKTPVVGPDDWRQDRDARFDSSPMPEGFPSPASTTLPQHARTDSSTTSGSDHRPLPPLPDMGHTRSQSSSSNGLSSTAERMLSSPRSLPSPPPATVSKLEIHNIGNGNMSLEERLKLMMLSDETSPKAADSSTKSFAEQQRERRMRRAGARDRVMSPTPEHEGHDEQHEQHDDSDAEANEEDDTVGDLSGFDMDYQLPSISRQSILRRVNGNKALERESVSIFNSPGPDPSSSQELPYDPDVPIASIEDSILDDENEGSVAIHESEDDKGDVYDLYQHSEDGDAMSHKDDLDEDEDDDNDDDDDDDDTDSHYSDEVEKPQPVTLQPEEDSITTPRAASPDPEGAITNFSATLPKVNNTSKETEFTRSLQSYMLPKPKEAGALTHSESRKMSDTQAYLQRPNTPEKPLSKPEYDGSGWGEPEEEEEPGTPESVIHHPVSDDYEEDEEETEEEEEQGLQRVEVVVEQEDEPENELGEEEPVESPAIPEQEATIKASSGSRLKTRPSATPSDIIAMREARRQVSREIPPVIPPIPERHRNRLSRDLAPDQLTIPTGDDFLERHPSFKQRSLTLDLDLGLSLDQDFERVIEAQKVQLQNFPYSYQFLAASGSPKRQVSSSAPKDATNEHNMLQPALNTNVTTRKQRGYLMRQNTKLVTASDKDTEEARAGTRSAGNSPIKQQRPQSWTVEPWNGKHRKSIKKRHGPTTTGPVPPMPGRESNSTAVSSLPEEDSHELATEECGERGRLFVKVMGVKDLDLPLPKNERTWFSLTLDNGVHCVTTAWLELARNAPIGQEFELVVPNELEFQLTLNVKLERPEPQVLPASPTKVPKPKTSTFSRVFASPKKRKEMEARLRAEEEAYAQAQRDAANKQRSLIPSAWDLLSPLTAEDGSFARAYVCLKEHESRCYGRPHMVEVASYNEWATEEAGFASSVKTKRTGVSSNSVVRRAPYKIGKLEVQLLFVPRPKGSTDEDMPKSMNSCIRELKAAEERLSRNWEGHLSQQGGDCPYWRRRYFKLVGTKLTAYHETTRQPRATINLSNAKRLIDDRRQLTNPETTGRNGKRRRSAFAEEEEGYMFVEEGFRIRFNNGEVIDFYADTPEDKDGWMNVLGDVIGRGPDDDDGVGAPGGRRKWCELVLKREEALRKRAEGRRVHSRTKSMII